MESGASVNIYMFHSGTNFAFTTGTHEVGDTTYGYTTSYFLNAPIDEAGDITPKYLAIRDVIKDFLPLPNVTISMIRAPKMQPPPIKLHPKTLLLSSMARRFLADEMTTSQYPIKFEEFDQFSGFLVYETFLPDSMPDPSVLHIPTLHDRAIVCVDNVSKNEIDIPSYVRRNPFYALLSFCQTFVGILSRETKADSIPMSSGFGRVLQIIVEHHGRNNFELWDNEFKGIIDDVWLNKRKIESWNHTRFPFENQTQLNELRQHTERDPDVLKKIKDRSTDRLLYGPVIFEGTFDLNTGEIFDTWIDPRGWGKVEYLLFSYCSGSHFFELNVFFYYPKIETRNRDL